MFAAPPPSSPSRSSFSTPGGGGQQPLLSNGTTMASASSHWPLVINLANCIVGVSVLAMPFVMCQCGLLLGATVVLASGWLTQLTCQLLIRAGHSARRRSYEQLALCAYGPMGKLAIEIVIITFLLSTLCAFLVVIGDLAPTVLYLGRLGRAPAMALVAAAVILPLSLLRDMSSLNTLCSLSILFYCAFVLRLFALAVPHMLDTDWMHEVRLFRTAGLWRSVPIVALALSCQTQLFQLARSVADSDSAQQQPQPHVMDSVVRRAVTLCQAMYCSVGALGYVAFHRSASGADGSIAGDVLLLLPESASTALIRLGFLLTVAVSFPLMLFPCRAALHNMLWHTSHGHGAGLELSGGSGGDSHSIPDGPFTLLTAGIIAFVLVTAVYIPNVEFVLGLSGSLVGSIVCIVAPAALFIKLAAPSHRKLVAPARFALAVGCFMLVVCTYATLSAPPAGEPHAGQLAAAAAVPPPVMPAANASRSAAGGGGGDSAKSDPAAPQLPIEKPPADAANAANGPAAEEDGEAGERREPPLPKPVGGPNQADHKRSADDSNIAADGPGRTDPQQQQVLRQRDGAGLGDVAAAAGGITTTTSSALDNKRLLAELEKQREVQHDLVHGQRLILDQLRRQQQQLVQQPPQQQPAGEQEPAAASAPPAVDVAKPVDSAPSAAPAVRQLPPDRGRLDNHKLEAAPVEHKVDEQKNEP